MNHTVIEQAEIVDIAAEGKAIAKANDLVIFVDRGVPGDIADIELIRKKRSFAEGRITLFHRHSALRTVPFCEHFGVCGGCKWQHMTYDAQLQFKQKQVTDALTRLAKINLPEIAPIIPSAATQYYRNKLEFTFSNRKWFITPGETEDEEKNALGFHIPKRFDKILDIEHCWLQPDPSNTIRLAIKKYALQQGLSFYDLKQQKGLLRNLIIRSSSNGELMVVMVFAEPLQEEIGKLMAFIAEAFPAITSLLYIINQKRNDTIFDQEVFCYKGRDFIYEEMPDDESNQTLKFKIGLKSFYQTNSQQAYTLYKTARDFAGFKGDELVYDLYTGTGTIANFVARHVQMVIGVEYIPSAIEDAKANSQLNNIANTDFFAGDLKEVLNTRFFETHGKPDVIITDPPRAGMHQDVTERIRDSGAEKIVYVSCNPATQARDLAILDEKYEVVKVQPVDMFPHTEHVENVVLLHKRKD